MSVLSPRLPAWTEAAWTRGAQHDRQAETNCYQSSLHNFHRTDDMRQGTFARLLQPISRRSVAHGAWPAPSRLRYELANFNSNAAPARRFLHASGRASDAATDEAVPDRPRAEHAVISTFGELVARPMCSATAAHVVCADLFSIGIGPSSSHVRLLVSRSIT